MKNKKIFIIYAGTQGTAGLYLQPILDCLKNTKIKVSAFTSYYYPFNNTNRIFYKYTDLARGSSKDKIRPYLRYLELIWGLLRIFIETLFNRPSLINYSLNSCYLPEYLFLLIITKVLRIPLMITCHDVMPFTNAYMKNNTELKRRQKIFDLSKFLLVHNNYSREVLVENFKIDRSKIVFHPFPIMDLKTINKAQKKKDIDFLFIGHLRKEKGIELLLSAWQKFHRLHPDANLYVAGNLPANNHINIAEYQDINIHFDLTYIDDDNYIGLIKRAKCIILPYTMGTNSGIPSSAFSVGTNVIASDLSMFLENQLIDKRFIFKKGDSNDLLNKMISFYNLKHTLTNNFDDTLRRYHQKFKENVKSIFTKIL